MNVVGLISSYKEGTLLSGAIRSLLGVGLSKLYVYEGPAGEPIDADVPDSDVSALGLAMDYRYHEGRWRTDARKRDEMRKGARADFPEGPLWGVILDGDEILVNGEYLRDLLQALMWQDERDPDAVPSNRYPLWLVEADGALSVIQSRVVRLDLIDRYEVSTSATTNVYGIREAWPNVPGDSRLYMEHVLLALENGRMCAWPPFPCQPHIFHRSHLRHPLRAGLRMHEQEAAEFEREQARLRAEGKIP